MSLIHNEKTKLLATALNTAAGSSFTVGVLAPMAASFYNFNGSAGAPLATIVLGTFLWLASAVALHISARYVLGGLKE